MNHQLQSNRSLICKLILQSVSYEAAKRKERKYSGISFFSKTDFAGDTTTTRRRPGRNQFYACYLLDSNGFIGDRAYGLVAEGGGDPDGDPLQAKLRREIIRLHRPAELGSEHDELFLKIPGNNVANVTNDGSCTITIADASKVQLLRYEDIWMDPEAFSSQRHRQQQRRLVSGKPSSIGTLTALMIRVTTDDAEPYFAADELHHFTFQSEVSLSRQMNRCSFGKLKIQPTKWGVVDVRLEGIMARGQPYDSIVNSVYPSALEEIARSSRNDGDTSSENVFDNANVQSIRELADLILIVLPPGTSSGDDWAAQASVGGYQSVYNDKWGAKVSCIMHEVGHRYVTYS